MSADPDISREEQLMAEHLESLDPALRAWAEFNRAYLTAGPDPLEDPDEEMDWWMDYLNGPRPEDGSDEERPSDLPAAGDGTAA